MKAKIGLSTRGDEQESDDLFASLTVMAYPNPKVEAKPKRVNLSKAKPNPVLAQLKSPKLPKMKSPQLIPRKPRRRIVLAEKPVRRSKFFFKLSESFQQELSRRKKALQVKSNPALEALDREVEERRKVYETELPSGLQTNIEQVREFILKEIAPLMMAVNAGTRQAQEVMQRTLNTAIDERPLAQFEAMTQSAGRMRMAKFITHYMGLDESVAEELLASVSPKKEMLIMHPGMLDDDRRTKPPKTKPAPKEPE